METLSSLVGLFDGNHRSSVDSSHIYEWNRPPVTTKHNPLLGCKAYKYKQNYSSVTGVIQLVLSDIGSLND